MMHEVLQQYARPAKLFNTFRCPTSLDPLTSYEVWVAFWRLCLQKMRSDGGFVQK